MSGEPTGAEEPAVDQHKGEERWAMDRDQGLSLSRLGLHRAKFDPLLLGERTEHSVCIVAEVACWQCDQGELRADAVVSSAGLDHAIHVQVECSELGSGRIKI